MLPVAFTIPLSRAERIPSVASSRRAYLHTSPVSKAWKEHARSGDCLPSVEKDTWIQLYELYEFTPDEIDNNKEITLEGSVDVKMIDEIVNCLFLSEESNIAGIHKELLRPPLQDSLLKLKEKFDKKR